MNLIYEWWILMWPNLASSALIAAVAFPIHHSKLKKHLKKLSEK